MPNYEITMDVEDSGSGTIVDPTQLNDAGNAKRAEAWAVGQRNGVDVPSTDPTYHNNSKYYALQAGSSAGSASSSADAAAAAAQHYPYVDSTSGNWMVWDTSTSAFVDTGVHAQGPTGPTGPGVPSGGTAGQVLKKVNGTDYNAEWANNDGTTIPMSSSDSTSINEAIANKVDVNTPTNDANTFANGITVVTASSGISNLPTNDRYTVYSWTLLESPLRRVQFAHGLSATYIRSYAGSWGNWQELALNSNLQKVSYASVVTDFNSCIETGVYCGNSASNSPIVGWVILSVTRLADNNNWVVQVAHETNNNRYFVRSRDNGTWRDWQELAPKSDMGNYSVQNGSANWGTEVTITRTANARMRITGARSGLGFEIVVPKDTNEYVTLSNVNSALSSVTVAMSYVKFTSKSSGYGSTIDWIAETWS